MNPDQPHDLSDYQLELGQTIGDISRAWRYQMNKRLKPFGLNLSTRQVLLQLQRHPAGLIQRELARKLGIESPTLVRLLDLLEQKEWVQRTISASDKRYKYAVLTPKANEQLQIIEKLSRQLRAEMMQGLSIADIESSTQVMRQMKSNLLPD
ncbi:MarR family winged helix-turn-helix transcriptional regulator [Herminiimonas sp. NPDC097707]|uniref:MarR family winged helix-turn-helix transcriptional regulator n=1 Tax=Herminiimonas sp. NPDC097707 TaxID=3364007 RepID=UPI00383B869C